MLTRSSLLCCCYLRSLLHFSLLSVVVVIVVVSCLLRFVSVSPFASCCSIVSLRRPAPPAMQTPLPALPDNASDHKVSFTCIALSIHAGAKSMRILNMMLICDHMFCRRSSVVASWYLSTISNPYPRGFLLTEGYLLSQTLIREASS